jgi:hypothetical protein
MTRDRLLEIGSVLVAAGILCALGADGVVTIRRWRHVARAYTELREGMNPQEVDGLFGGAADLVVREGNRRIQYHLGPESTLRALERRAERRYGCEGVQVTFENEKLVDRRWQEWRCEGGTVP